MTDPARRKKALDDLARAEAEEGIYDRIPADFAVTDPSVPAPEAAKHRQREYAKQIIHDYDGMIGDSVEYEDDAYIQQVMKSLEAYRCEIIAAHCPIRTPEGSNQG